MKNSMLSALRRLREEKGGQDLLEYALLAGAAASMAVAVFPAIVATTELYSQVLAALAAAVSAGGATTTP